MKVPTLGWRIIALSWMAVIWWLSDQPDLQSGLEQDFLLRKIAHVTEYGILTWLLLRSFGVPITSGSLAWAAIIAVIYAVVDEWHQSFVIGRSGKLADVVIDVIGVVLVVVHTLWRKKSNEKAPVVSER